MSTATTARSPARYQDAEVADPEARERTRMYGDEFGNLTLRDWWYQAQGAHAANRIEQSIDCNFADGLQWTEEDRRDLEDRGQPPLTFNVVKPIVEWLTGTERRTRVDWRILPRRGDEEANYDAWNKTELMKYISDVNKYPYHRSRAFRDAVQAGIGWLEVGLHPEPGHELIRIRRESWRNVWYDPTSIDPALEDCRYLFRSKVLDLDIAQAMFPDHKEALHLASEMRDHFPHDLDADTDSEIALWYNPGERTTVTHATQIGARGHRKRVGVRIVECWYKKPVRIRRMAGATRFPHRTFDSKDPEFAAMQAEIQRGDAEVYERTEMQMWVCVFLDRGAERSSKTLYHKRSPYQHNRFPLVPVWGYRRDYDGMCYGSVRNARDPQEDLNKRRSKLLFLLSTNRVIATEGAVRDMTEEEVAEEAARPDAVFIIGSGPNEKFEIINNLDVASGHLQLEGLNREYVREASGVTTENLGLSSNAQSGRAILARQEQGSVVTQTLFDNLRLAMQSVGELALSMIEQFYTDERELRITGSRGRPDFVTLNTMDEEGRPMNHLTAMNAEFIVAEQDFRESTRIAMFDAITEMLGGLPGELQLQLVDLLFDMSDLPEPVKGEWVRRLRKINGQPDPEQETDEERMAREQAEEEAAAEEARMARLERQVEIAKRMAETNQTNLRAGGEYVRALKDALEVVPAFMTEPAVERAASDMVNEGSRPPPDVLGLPSEQDPVIQEVA